MNLIPKPHIQANNTLFVNQEKAVWTAMWGNAVSRPDHLPAEYAKDITLRYPVFAPFAGTALRFRFDNYCGSEPITIADVYVSHKVKETIEDTPGTGFRGTLCDASTIVPITFCGKTNITIAPGKNILSDEIPFTVVAKEMLTISFYLPEFTQMNSCVFTSGPLSGGFFSKGNHSADRIFPVETARSTNWIYFLSDIDILTQPENHAVICFGDSITAQSWPDYLTLFLAENENNHISVIRKAVCGTRILRQYDCVNYDSYGLMGKNRMPHELNVTGATDIILQHGINDIIHPVGYKINQFRPMSDLPTASELEDGFAWYINQSRNAGLRVYGGTLVPIWNWRTYAPFREDLKNDFNDWIRNTDLLDDCMDFDLAVRDDENPVAFKKGYDSGDHLHPSEEAYQAMARCVQSKLNCRLVT
ncbi:MAG: GDSL-type esterase/lipase family protein [Lachnospiraceae bacterium]|nr:GDSL-type esterase/lipase family protein [Lachnospiraceae bacterium]